MVVVVYSMIGKPKDSRSFDTWAEARAFMKALAICDCCDSYSVDKEASTDEPINR